MRQNIEDTRPSKIELKLNNIIGRKAYNRHQNLFYDYNEKILYLAGCNLVIANPKVLEQEENEIYSDDDDSQDEEDAVPF